ncbi:MAG: hypothetical protein NC417_13135 [Candidatus Gastranaerophilales bacterium]|nr:hypothetical protein [Candidatus Gastranaerophilales bacterium]
MTDTEKLDLILAEMQGMKADMQGMKAEIQDLKTDLEEVKEKVTKIDLTIDNEIRVNIQRVAEGHLDLSRNMHEVMKPNNEIEMLAIKVRMLETDMREIKSKIS